MTNGSFTNGSFPPSRVPPRRAENGGPDQGSHAKRHSNRNERLRLDFGAHAPDSVIAIIGAGSQSLAAAIAKAFDQVVEDGRQCITDLFGYGTGDGRAAAAGDAADILKLLFNGTEVLLDRRHACRKLGRTLLKHGVALSSNTQLRNALQEQHIEVLVEVLGRNRSAAHLFPAGRQRLTTWFGRTSLNGRIVFSATFMPLWKCHDSSQRRYRDGGAFFVCLPQSAAFFVLHYPKRPESLLKVAAI
ncbi:MAG TPA: hypothetical protein VMA30_13225 [Xanthobacteraceae bacterium]|nr:hypothetical protein [Xanthobacteraceae bacterium]